MNIINRRRKGKKATNRAQKCSSRVNYEKNIALFPKNDKVNNIANGNI